MKTCGKVANTKSWIVMFSKKTSVYSGHWTIERTVSDWIGLKYCRIGLEYCRIELEYCRVELEYCIIGFEYFSIGLEYCRIELDDFRTDL